MATDRIRRSRGGENYLEDGLAGKRKRREKEPRSSGMVRTAEIDSDPG